MHALRGVDLEVAADASISQIIEPFGLPPKLVHLVLVNGNYIQPAERAGRTLAEGGAALQPRIAARLLGRMSGAEREDVLTHQRAGR